MELTNCQIFVPHQHGPLFYKSKTYYGEIELYTPIMATVVVHSDGQITQTLLPITKVRMVAENTITFIVEHKVKDLVTVSNHLIHTSLIPYNETARLLYENDSI